MLPNPIDTTLFSPDQAVSKSERCRIVTVGNIGKRKGSDILFEALAKLPKEVDWELYHVGDSMHIDKYIGDAGATSLTDRITCLGTLSQIELANVFSNSDLYVVSSRRETANTSMLQAMSCGVPVVTTRCGGPETLLDDSVSVSVKNECPQALSNGIELAINNIQNYDRVKMRQFVEDRYSKSSVLGLVEQAYQRAIAHTQNGK